MADGDRDKLIRRTDEAEEHSSGRARMFDLRRLIGGLFVVYGIMVAIAGVLDSGAEITKAQGVRINLWTGLAMLLLGAFFLIWQWLRPLRVDRRASSDAGWRAE